MLINEGPMPRWLRLLQKLSPKLLSQNYMTGDTEAYILGSREAFIFPKKKNKGLFDVIVNNAEDITDTMKGVVKKIKGVLLDYEGVTFIHKPAQDTLEFKRSEFTGWSQFDEVQLPEKEVKGVESLCASLLGVKVAFKFANYGNTPNVVSYKTKQTYKIMGFTCRLGLSAAWDDVKKEFQPNSYVIWVASKDSSGVDHIWNYNLKKQGSGFSVHSTRHSSIADDEKHKFMNKSILRDIFWEDEGSTVNKLNKLVEETIS